MGSSRYFYSFIISVILYSLFLYGAYSINFKKRPEKEKKPKIVKISLLEPKIKPKPKVLEKKKDILPLAPIPLIKKPKPKPKPKKKITKLKKSKSKKRKSTKKRKLVKKRVLKKDKTKIKRKLKKTKRLVKRVKPKLKPKTKSKARRVIKRVKKRAIKKSKINYSYKKRRANRVKRLITPPPTPKIVEPTSYIVEEEYIEEYIPPTPIKRVSRRRRVEVVEPKVIKPSQYSSNNRNIKPIKREIKEVVNKKVTTNRDLSGEKRIFLSNLRESINANKIYPKRAKRMGLEGVVRVTFDISRSGDVLNIRTSSSAPNILKRAVIKAVRDSFPITIPNSLRSQFPLRDVSVNIFFKLH